MTKYLEYSCGCIYASIDHKKEIKAVHLCDTHKAIVIDDALDSLEVKLR